MGERGRAKRRKRKMDSELWGSRTEHTEGLPNSGRQAESVGQPGGLKRVGKPSCLSEL